MSACIEINDLKKAYRVGRETRPVLRGVSLTIKQGDLCCFLGASGSGKSTLLNILAGLERPNSGSIVINDVHVERMTENQLTKFRRDHIGFVFQSYNLISHFTAIENVALPLMIKKIPKQFRDALAKKMLTSVGLSEFLHHKPSQMSGGQQQRVGIARAFISKPNIVFADEPTGNLDSDTAFEIMSLMLQKSSNVNSKKQTVVIVTHDKKIAAYADIVFEVVNGRAIEFNGFSKGLTINESKI